MESLPSAEFRKRYAKLSAQTQVTVNGHVIGTWMPAGTYVPSAPRPETLGVKLSPQGRRDELLRKINRGR